MSFQRYSSDLFDNVVDPSQEELKPINRPFRNVNDDIGGDREADNLDDLDNLRLVSQKLYQHDLKKRRLSPWQKIQLMKKCCYCCCCSILILAILALIVSCVAYLTILVMFRIDDSEVYWDWTKLDVSKASFPSKFIWGTATAAHQVEGYCHRSNWCEFEKKINPETMHPYIRNGEKSGRAADQWNLYAEDIQLMKNELFVNTYRFSISWSKIEPYQGVYNWTAIQHYHDLIEQLVENNIEPMMTLHHFTEPIWFSEKGGFELEQNIDYFVNFSKFAFSEYFQVPKSKGNGNPVTKFCTINEPNVYSVMGYSLGVFPPAKKDNQLTGVVLKNLLEAHVRVYKELKKMDPHNETEIGIVLNIVQFDAWSIWNPFDRIIAHLLNDVYSNAALNFFKTGYYHFYQPFVASVEHKNDDAMISNDFFGLNYYYHNHIQYNPFSISHPYVFLNRSDEVFTDMGWPIYPEGIYRAIKKVSELNLPIIVTENGIADEKDDRRKLFTERYLFAVSKAIEEGANVKGYIYWSFCDNFEWAEGFFPRFGLYKVDYETQKRTLREGSKVFVDTVKKSRGI